MLYLKLAWRNIWRNKRRTFITMLSIIVAVMLSSVMRTMNEGSYEQMIENTVGIFTGYVQIHQKGYWDDKTLENTLVSSDTLFQIIAQTPGITKAVPRIESYALVAGENQSRAAMVIGIDPEKERSLSDPQNRIVTGSYFEDLNERSVLLGTDLVQRLELQVGDSLVMIGQGFRGQSAAGLYEVKGTVRFPNPEMNKSLVMMPLGTAQFFLAAPDRLTGISLIIEDSDDAESVTKILSGYLSSEDYEVMDWKELMPELVQAIESDRGSGLIIIMILYVVVGFGILGTVLMMITERTYEFGVMISVGTSRFAIAMMLAFEVLLMAMAGSLVGIVASYPISYYFHINPIRLSDSGDMAQVIETFGMEPVLQFSLEPSLFYSQAIIIFVITLIFCLIPILKASRLNPVKAMRS